MKKIIPAICMLLITACLLGSSTFAWFSMNTKVTASSMTVKATASKNLLISDAQNGTYLPSLALTTSQTSMVPVSTSGTTPTFYKLKDVGHGMIATDSKYAFDTTFEAAAATDYVKETMWIKSTGANAANLTATVSFTGGVQALDPALRVMIISGSEKIVMTPVTGAGDWKGIASISAAEAKQQAAANAGADANGKALVGVTYYTDADCTNAATGVVAASTDVTSYYVIIPAGVPTLNTANEVVKSNGATVASSLTADEAIQVDVYIWYEGQDPSCKSTNAVTLDNTVFTIEFNVAG